MPTHVSLTAVQPDIDNCFLGPVQDSSGNLYYVSQNGSNLAVYKSTDGGSTWSLDKLQSDNALSVTSRVVHIIGQSGNTAYVLCLGNTTPFVYAVDLPGGTMPQVLTGSWPAANLDGNGYYPCYGARRSDGSFVVLYNSATEAVMGAGRRRVSVVYGNTSGAPQTPVVICPTGVTNNYDAKGCVVGDSNNAITHLLYLDSATPASRHRSISDANSLGTDAAVLTLPSATASLPMTYNDGFDGAARKVSMGMTTGLVMARGTSAANPSFGTDFNAITNLATNHGSMLVFDTDNNVMYLFYIDSVSSDIVYMNVANGSTTWGNKTTIDTLSSGSRVSAGKISGKIGIIYNDSTTLYYSDISTASSTPKSSSDTNSTTTEAVPSIVITTSDTNGATTEAIGGRTALLPDSNGTTTETASVAITVTDVNSTTTETSAITVPVAASDVNGATTESGSVHNAVPTATDANATTTEATVQTAVISGTDVNGTTTDVASILFATTDQNGATTESGLLVFLVSVTDVNSTLTETISMAQSTTDANGSTTESGSLGGQQVSGTDSNSATTESVTEIAAISGTDANGSTSEVVSQAQAVSDANGTTTEAASANAQLSQTDANSTTTENASTGAPVSASDSNGATTDVISARVIQYPDQNGVATESGQFTYIFTTTDANAGVSESASLGSIPISSSDANSTTSEITNTAMTTTDVNSVTTESASSVTSFSTSDANSVTTESTQTVLTTADSNSVSTENVAMKYTVTDSSSVISEVGGIGTIKSGTDTNAGIAESVSTVVSGLTGTDLGSGAESASETVLSASSDTGTSSETAAPRFVFTATDGSTVTSDVGTISYVPISVDAGHGTETPLSVRITLTDNAFSTDTANLGTINLVVFDSGTIFEDQSRSASGTIPTSAPHKLLGVRLPDAVLYDVEENEPQLLANGIRKPILKGAVKKWRP
jgi:hypothetical protein